MNYTESNKKAWEEAFDHRDADWGRDIVHRVQTEDYAFFQKDMAATLRTVDFSGKVVGQFCCNNGRELLSLVKTTGAKKGFGFDIAENQIAFANEKAKELMVDCEFVATDILKMSAEFNDRFDIIIITIGVFRWFQDLGTFFGKVSDCLKSDGRLIINEEHPMTNMLSRPGDGNYVPTEPAKLVNSYFYEKKSMKDGIFYITKKEYESEEFIEHSHSLGEIISAMSKANIFVTRLSEYDYDISDDFEHLDGRQIPLSFIVEAVKR